MDVKYNDSDSDDDSKARSPPPKVTMVPANAAPSPPTKAKRVAGIRHIKIKELNTDIISPKSVSDYNSSKICIIGKSGTGKTTIIKSLIHEKSHIIPIGMVFSGTEDSNHFWSGVFPETFIFNGLDMDRLESFVRRQRISKQYLENPWAVILLDDVMDDPKILNRPFFHGMYKNGRHWNMLFILSSQYSMDIRPAIRTNIDCTFILREPNFRNRKCMWENYASIIPDFRDFCQIMDQITTDYTALVIVNSVQSNNWQDCVFWYKARPVPKDWKFGCKEYWDFHNERYNKEYVEKY